MKKFLLKLFLLLCPIILYFITSEILLRQIPNNYRYKKQYLDTHANTIQTLILGCSHSYYGINPEYLDWPAFNAANNSQTLHYDLAILRRYESSWKSLKTVVLPISYFTFFESLRAGKESWRIKNYVLYHQLESSYNLKDNSEVLGNLQPLNLRRLYHYYFKGEDARSCNAVGWDSSYQHQSEQGLELSGQLAAERHSKDLEEKQVQAVFQQNKKELEEIVSWCRSRNIKLIFVTTPTSASYHQTLNAQQLNLMKTFTDQLVKNNTQCYYYDLLKNSNYQSTDFYDADHLNQQGAIKLSKWLNQKILSLN